MTNWRDRLCGSLVVKTPGEEENQDIKQILQSNKILSCGGGFFPVNMNQANMHTMFKSSFILPTKKYSVLVFKQDGHAVIYSEEDEVARANADPYETTDAEK